MTFLVALPSQSVAQMGPNYWQVAGVAADDHLNVRSGPGANYRIVATAPNGFTFRNLGCRGTGNSRWCHVETTGGQTSGWVAGRFLREAGGPGAAAVPASDVPELYARNTGEIKVGVARGGTVLCNLLGMRITVGSSCPRGELNRAHDAVLAYLRENAPGADHGGGNAPSANVNLTGTGTFYGGDSLNGRIDGSP